MYLAVVLLLAALIVRGVAFEYRGKSDPARWRHTWNRLLICLLHGETFLSLKTTGDRHERSRLEGLRVPPFTGAAVIGFIIWTHVTASSALFLNLIELLAILAVVAAVWLVYEHRDGFFAATTVTIAACIGSIFTGLCPNVMVSSANPADNLTVHNIASAPYSLKAMTVVVIVFLPLVLAYQAWTYYGFRRRVSREEFLPASEPAPEPTTATDAAVRLPVSEAEGKGP